MIMKMTCALISVLTPNVVMGSCLKIQKNNAMTAMKIMKTNVPMNAPIQSVVTVFNNRAKNVMMETELIMISAPTPVLFQYVATVFFNKLKTRSAMMETK